MPEEDKRIRKTKKGLKQALVKLLEDQPFEQITVKQLCDVSDTSRLTFYSHYSDKYALATDLIKDMVQIATDDYHRLQAENNPGGDSVQSYCNLLDCILSLYHNDLTFFAKNGSGSNPYLSFTFCNYVLQYIEERIEKESHALSPKYSPKKAACFICYGLWGFVSRSHAEKCPLEQIRTESREILASLLKYEVLTRNN